MPAHKPTPAPFTPGLPTGTVTFLFTDIEGSTKLWEQYPDAMREALQRHDTLLREAVEANGGYVFKTVGDAFCAAFPTAVDALAATLSAHRALQAEDWGETGPLKIRAGLHTGIAQERDGDYFGPALNRVARLQAAGHGRQTLLSLPTYELVRDHLPAGVQLLDMGEHRLKDLLRPERVYQLVTPDLPSQFPPLKTLDNRPNNLPRQTTAFIGRDKEIEVVAALVRKPDVALVTLTGPGGTGKTRLGLQIAADLLDDFSDGVWFVELAAITEPRLVVPTIAQTLGVKEAGGTPIIDTLKAYLKEKELLLLLDNFEQVSDTTGGISELLAACPRLKVLATSRVPLRIRGEKEYAVSPLELPDLKHLPSLERLTQYEAVRLFIERATDVKADFQVTNENAPAVAEICTRLDGLPLAIELAAARIKMLPPQAILTRLSQRLKLLTGGARDLTARQQTLRGAIDWSYDLLDEGHKEFFRRMAVFQGGRTLEALEAVCNYDGELQVDVFDGVEVLLANNLIQQREGSDGEPRFVMLETIHEYAREKLQESGEAEALQREHALYFMRLSEEGELHIRSPKDKYYSDKFEDEFDNIRAALQWSLTEGNPEIGARMAASLAMPRFWGQRMHVSEGQSWLAQILAKPQLAGRTSLRAKTLMAAGSLADNWGELATALALWEEALAIYREREDQQGMGRALGGTGWVTLLQGDLVSSRTYLEEALAIRRHIGDMRDVAHCTELIAQLDDKEGNYESARTLNQQALILWRSLGDKGGIANVSNTLGELEKHLGNYAVARTLLEEAVVMAREEKRPRLLATALTNLSHLLLRAGDHEQALSCLTEGLMLRKDQGGKLQIAESLLGWAALAIAQDQPERASRLLGAVDHLLQDSGATLWPTDQIEYERTSTVTRAQLGEEAFERGRQEGERMSMEQAIEYALEHSLSEWQRQ
jgi:predicted ATPase/class 3 adenylate cyclase